MLSVAECVYLACVLEATARKPGNVHRFRDFDDLTYLDLIVSAAAVAPILGRTAERGVGASILEAVRETRRFVSTNSNLGIVLLLAPLAAVPPDRALRSGMGEVLDRLTLEDSRAVFEAIRLAKPGGLGGAQQEDVRNEPTLPLREIMDLAAERDVVARQYANGFHEVFEVGVPALLTPYPLRFAGEWSATESAIIHCHLRLLAANPDSHIARRCSPALAEEASARARRVLEEGDIAEFDAWLRADGDRRNPGSTADLVTASLYVALREGNIILPGALSWNAIASG